MKHSGAVAPEFQLPGVTDEGFETHSLSASLDSGPTILSFFPFAFSPVCTRHMCRFRDAEWLSVGDGMDVFGLSCDSAYALKAFRETHEMQIPMLSDRLADVARSYGVQYKAWEGHPLVPKRAIFAIDEDGIIQYAWSTDNANEEPSLGTLQESVEWQYE